MCQIDNEENVSNGSHSCDHQKKFELPWYFTIISWLLLWVVTLGSMAMVIFYGISFKDETCKKWITSMVVSFFMSVFVTQPIKVTYQTDITDLLYF